jgi:hypothetical protein
MTPVDIRGGLVEITLTLYWNIKSINEMDYI